MPGREFGVDPAARAQRTQHEHDGARQAQAQKDWLEADARWEACDGSHGYPLERRASGDLGAGAQAAPTLNRSRPAGLTPPAWGHACHHQHQARLADSLAAGDAA